MRWLIALALASVIGVTAYLMDYEASEDLYYSHHSPFTRKQ